MSTVNSFKLREDANTGGNIMKLYKPEIENHTSTDELF